MERDDPGLFDVRGQGRVAWNHAGFEAVDALCFRLRNVDRGELGIAQQAADLARCNPVQGATASLAFTATLAL